MQHQKEGQVKCRSPFLARSPFLPNSTVSFCEGAPVFAASLLVAAEHYRRRITEGGGVEICVLLLRTEEPANRIVALQVLYNLMGMPCALLDRSSCRTCTHGTVHSNGTLCSGMDRCCWMLSSVPRHLETAFRGFCGSFVSVEGLCVDCNARHCPEHHLCSELQSSSSVASVV